MTESRIATPVRPRRPRKHLAFAACLLLIPLVAGAVVAAVWDMDPARAWTPAGKEPGAAPASVTAAEASPSAAQELADARRAAIEAQSQASLLASGAKQLADGTHKLKGGADGVGGGLDQLTSGVNDLSNGLKEIQAGTGELGSGANEIADKVGGAVDQVAGVGAVRGQLLAAIDDAMHGLEGNKSPDAKKTRDQLSDLRGQVDSFVIDDRAKGDLQRLKDGSRELANQLSVPGYAYHDGIYEAAKGAENLNSALQGADGKAGDATSGVEKLDDGAAKIAKMAEDNRARLESLQRALPAEQGGVAGAGDAGGESSLSPVVAMLIAALVMLGGLATGWAVAAGAVRRRYFAAIGSALLLTAGGEVLLFVLASGVQPLGAVAAGGAFFLASLVSTMAAHAAFSVFGPVTAAVFSAVFTLVQLGAVGWVWKTAATQDLPGFWRVIANVFPLHWTTAAVTAAGNSGQISALWIPLALLAVAVICAWAVLPFTRSPQAEN